MAARFADRSRLQSQRRAHEFVTSGVVVVPSREHGAVLWGFARVLSESQRFGGLGGRLLVSSAGVAGNRGERSSGACSVLCVVSRVLMPSDLVDGA